MCIEIVRFIFSFKLWYKGEKDYDSDNVFYCCRVKDEDELSDSLMIVKIELWCMLSWSVVRLYFDLVSLRFLLFFVGNVKISVIFFGSEDENNNFYKISNFE